MATYYFIGHSCGVPVLTEYCTYGPSHQTTWDEGQNIHFKCPPGYEMHGQGTATCHNGKWSYPSPICKKSNNCHSNCRWFSVTSLIC